MPTIQKHKSFGALIQNLRKERGWTVKELIERIENKVNKTLSPAYVTRIELHGEIPSPELICVLADIFNYDIEELFECAKEIKINKFSESLEEKYKQAAGFYRKQKSK